MKHRSISRQINDMMADRSRRRRRITTVDPVKLGNEPSLVFDSIESYTIAKFINDRPYQSIISKQVDVNTDVRELTNWMSENGLRVVNPESHIFIAYNNYVMLDVTKKNWAIKIRVIGTAQHVDAYAAKIESAFSSNPCYVKYVYDPQYMEYTTLPINTDRQPIQEMYPWLDESIESFYDRFIASSANILILTGVPGSGKTTFIRGMLSHTRQSAILAYHPKIIEQDSFFVQWIESDDMFMVLEDADNLITPRADGNDVMSKFLNIGDGLMSFKGKKIVFSTNLPNISSIDPALTRGGRCFDVLQFDYLNRSDAQKLADKVGLPLGEGDKFTVSDIFSASRNEVKFARENTEKRKFGFV